MNCYTIRNLTNKCTYTAWWANSPKAALRNFVKVEPTEVRSNTVFSVTNDKTGKTRKYKVTITPRIESVE